MKPRLILNFVLALAGVSLIGSARADAVRPWVDLVFAPVAEPCATRYMDVALWTYSNDANSYAVGAITAILDWDPNTIRLVSLVNDGPYAWLSSSFPNDIENLNDTWLDGDAYYEAYAQLGAPAFATPAGLKVVTFRFRKLHVGAPTPISTPAAFGLYARTLVLSGSVPNTDILAPDGLASATPTPHERGDANCDGVIDFFDIDPFVDALQGPAWFGILFPGCNWFNSDVNCDGDVNFFDIDPWVDLLNG